MGAPDASFSEFVSSVAADWSSFAYVICQCAIAGVSVEETLARALRHYSKG